MQNSELLKKYGSIIFSTFSFSMPDTPLQTTQHKIKTFAYQSIKSFHKSYTSFLAKYRNREEMRDFIKIGTLFWLFLLFGGLFMYYINLASTRGYFMRLANQKLQATKAKSDIVKLEIIRKKRENRDNLHTPKALNLQKNLLVIEVPDLSGTQTKN